MESGPAQLRVEIDHIVAGSSEGAERQVAGLLNLCQRCFGLDVAIVASLRESQYTVVAMQAPFMFRISPGTTFRVETSICGEPAALVTAVRYERASSGGPAWHPAYREFALEAYLGVPLRIDGRVWGLLSALTVYTRREPLGPDALYEISAIGTAVEDLIGSGQLKTPPEIAA